MATSSFWSGLFEVLTKGIDLVASIWRSKPENKATQEDDAQAARAGTAAGATAHEAAHIVEGGPKEQNQ